MIMFNKARDDPPRSSLIFADLSYVALAKEEWRQGLFVQRECPCRRGRFSPRRKKVIRADRVESALPI